MRFVILITANPAAREAWASLPDEERAAGMAAYAALDAELRASGELVVSEQLGDPSQAKRLSFQQGRPVVTDGPFAEAKEQLAGFYLVDCDSADRAAEIAALIPGAGDLAIEVWHVTGAGTGP